MATTVGSHSVSAFATPVNGGPLDANVVRGNDNTIRTAYVAHDSDTGIHVQSSSLASRPTAGTAGRKWITVDTGSYKLWYDDGTTWHEVGTATIDVFVIADEALVKGDVVKVTGYNNGTGAPRVAKVSSASDVAFGIINTATIANGATGYLTNTGIIQDVATNAFAIGDILYPNTSGGFTATKPTSGNYQPVAFVLRSNSNNGVLYVEFSAPRIVERSDNTASTVVLRDASGNFSAGTITAGALTSTGLVTFASLKGTGSTTVTNILDEDNMASDSATALATQQSIKAYVDAKVATVDTLAEVLANGNTTGANNIIVSAGQRIQTPAITAGDGTASATIANSTGVMTIASSVLTTTDINGGTIDGTTIGGASAAAGTFTTINATTINATTFDMTNLEVTNIKAKDGTAAMTIADTTGNVAVSTAFAANGNVTLGDATSDTITVGGSFPTGTKLRTAQSVGNTLAVSAYDVDGTAYVDLITATASNTPTLALTSTGTGSMNNIAIGGSTPAAGAFTTLDASGDFAVATNKFTVASASGNTAVAGTLTTEGTLTSNGNTVLGNAATDTITATAQFVTGTQLKSAQSSGNTLALAAYDVDGTAYTSLVTLTAGNTPTLALTSVGTGTLDNVTIGGTTAAAGTFTAATVSGNLTLGADVVLSRGAANRLDLASGDSLNVVSGDYQIAGSSVLNATTLGSGVTASSLTSVGTLSSLTVSGASVLGQEVSRNATSAVMRIAGGTVADGGTLYLYGSTNATAPGRFYAVANGTGSFLVSVGGFDRLAIDSSGNLAVDTNTLYVDATNNRVGVGTASPSGALHVAKSGTYAYQLMDSYGAGYYGLMDFRNSGNSTIGSYTATVNGDNLLLMRMYGTNSGNTAFAHGASFIAIQTAAAGATYVPTALTFGTSDGTNAVTERARITSDGIFLVAKTASNAATAGCEFSSTGAVLTRSGGDALLVNRQTNDGTLVSLRQDNVEEGSISVSGNTVSYNAFAGSHWSQLQDGSKPDILRGTVMESINELCVWPGEQNERLPKSKISDTAGSKKVYGVFMAWDNDWTTTNDMYVTAVGAFICRINGSVTVQEGDLLESNGDGTARVQADDIIRSSTIGKVTSTVKTHQYEDGTYCVPTVLYCG